MGEKEIRGYKVFQPDWTCRNMKFEVGKIYEENVTPQCCKSGIHFCLILEDCFAYYEFNSKNKVTEVLALGDVDFDLKTSKCCTNKIQIVRELDWQEVMNLLNINKGYKVFHSDWKFKKMKFKVGRIYEENEIPKYCEKGFHYCLNLLDCLDYCVIGEEKEYRIAEVAALGDIDFYSLGRKCCTNKIKIIKELNWLEVLYILDLGQCTKHKDYRNVGIANKGNFNTGSYNQGSRNTGNYNIGHYNVGRKNIGDYNIGDYNIGAQNTSSCNIGSFNTANCSIGNYNTGEQNKGNYNTGKYNTGNYNTGDWNKTNFSNGCFNTIEPKICLFDKPSDWTYRIWKNSKANKILSRITLTEWISKENMTEEEKQRHKEFTVTGGYLKYYNFYEACQIWWKSLSDREKNIIQWIPNFDAAIFKQVTGIDINK